jgi:hypothetical protein
MAVKKTTKKKEAPATPAKAEAKETAPKKTTKPKPKAAAPKAPAAESAPVAASTPAAKAKPKAAAPKKAAPAAVKLSSSQSELLKKIGGTGEAGYTMEKKAEERQIESLLEKKLIKKGAKDKATGKLKYHISTAGKKHTS